MNRGRLAFVIKELLHRESNRPDDEWTFEPPTGLAVFPVPHNFVRAIRFRESRLRPREAALLTSPNMMRAVCFVLVPMVATGPASMQMKPLTPEVFADNLTPSTTAASDQNAQSQNTGATGKPDESLLILRTTVSEVHLVFVVTDKHGRYIRGLKKDDFKILDDRKPPKEILSFHSETDLPLQVGLLIDTSQSVRDRFKFEQEAAIEFLNQTIRPRYDQSLVI